MSWEVHPSLSAESTLCLRNPGTRGQRMTVGLRTDGPLQLFHPFGNHLGLISCPVPREASGTGSSSAGNALPWIRSPPRSPPSFLSHNLLSLVAAFSVGALPALLCSVCSLARWKLQGRVCLSRALLDPQPKGPGHACVFSEHCKVDRQTSKRYIEKERE